MWWTQRHLASKILAKIILSRIKKIAEAYCNLQNQTKRKSVICEMEICSWFAKKKDKLQNGNMLMICKIEICNLQNGSMLNDLKNINL